MDSWLVVASVIEDAEKNFLLCVFASLGENPLVSVTP